MNDAHSTRNPDSDSENRNQRADATCGEPRRPSWIGAAVVCALTVGALWYGYRTMNDHDAALGAVQTLQQSHSSLDARVTESEAKVRESMSEQENLRARMSNLENGVDSKIRRAIHHATEVGERVYQRVRAELDSRMGRLHGRLARLEEENDSEAVRLARLNAEVARLQEHIAIKDAQLAEFRQNEQISASRLASLHEQAESSRRQLQRVQRSLEVRRFDFELAKNRNQELAPGVSIQITGTNVARRQVKGWIWLMPDRKTIWLRNHAALQPVVFYSKADGKRREVVFTAVTKHSATGYILMSADAEPGLVASASGQAGGSAEQ